MSKNTIEALSVFVIAVIAYSVGYWMGYSEPREPSGTDAICHALNPPRHPYNWRISLPSGDTWASGHCP